MDEKYNSMLALIKDKEKKIKQYEILIKNFYSNDFNLDFEQFSKDTNQYIKNYLEYLGLLEKYETAEKISPLDVFPGIQTVKTISDTDSFKKDNSKMEALASSIKNFELTLEKRESDLINGIKNASKDLNLLLSAKEEIQEGLTQIMEDMDSVYDVGFLSKTN